MFEARLSQANLLKKVLEAIKDLVTNANFDCSSRGLSLQAMDSSHVALVAMMLRADGFEYYRCDRNLSLGIEMKNMSNVLKCANNDDQCTLKADEGGDSLTFLFDNEKNKKISDFELKLIDIDGEHLGIPEQEYDATVKMPSSEFLRIIRDLSILGDTVVISVSKEEIRFSCNGEIGQGNITLRQQGDADTKPEECVSIEMTKPVSLTFAIRYLSYFTKATSLSTQVSLQMSPDVPLNVQYRIEDLGYVRYYLAPKIDDDQA